MTARAVPAAGAASPRLRRRRSLARALRQALGGRQAAAAGGPVAARLHEMAAAAGIDPADADMAELLARLVPADIAAPEAVLALGAALLPVLALPDPLPPQTRSAR
jgi:hypothetical protein